MPRKSEPEPTGPDPAVPRARSVACRKCGEPVSFDQVDGDVVVCECGASNVVEED